MKIHSLLYYLQILSRDDILDYLTEKHRDLLEENEQDNAENILSNHKKGYEKAIDELLLTEPHEEQETIEILFIEDSTGPEPFSVDVVLQNKNFLEKAPTNLKIWGGKHDDEFDCPKGYFNINWDGYQEHFALSGCGRGKILENYIIIDPRAFNFLDKKFEAVVGEILFELTFHGYTQKDSDEFFDQLKKDVENLKTSDFFVEGEEVFVSWLDKENENTDEDGSYTGKAIFLQYVKPSSVGDELLEHEPHAYVKIEGDNFSSIFPVSSLHKIIEQPDKNH